MPCAFDGPVEIAELDVAAERLVIASDGRRHDPRSVGPERIVAEAGRDRALDGVLVGAGLGAAAAGVLEARGARRRRLGAQEPRAEEHGEAEPTRGEASHLNQKISGHHGARADRKSPSARRSAPRVCSTARPASARRVKVKPPR